MTVPNLIPAEGTVISVRPSPAYSPYTPAWWLQAYIDHIPESAVGWLVAQGWQIVEATEDTTCGQTFYKMSRQSMNSWMILQATLNEYVQRYNEANTANIIRYENIITLWNEVIHKSRDQMDVQGDVSDGHISIFVSQMDELVTSVQSEMDAALSEATAAGAIVAAQLASYLVTLGQLEPLYDTHEIVAEGFLTDLGATELARINEQFDTLLAKNRQSIVDRGLYSSAIDTAIAARVERERSEAISKLNDQLAREKLANEHQLFGQEMQVKGAVLDGKLKVSQAQQQQGQYLVEVRTKCALAVMQARLQRLQGRMDIQERENKLMAYQLDLRNNLVVGLFGFMERRSDDAPNFKDMVGLITGLGDQSGGNWVTT